MHIVPAKFIKSILCVNIDWLDLGKHE